MKNIKDLTDNEAIEILKDVFSNEKHPHKFIKISKEKIISSEDKEQIILGGNSIIHILYDNGDDECILHFTDTKVVLWLYKNNYNITDLLEYNKYLTDMENNFEKFAISILIISKGKKGYAKGYEQNYTLENIENRCKVLLDRYYYEQDGVSEHILNNSKN